MYAPMSVLFGQPPEQPTGDATFMPPKMLWYLESPLRAKHSEPPFLAQSSLPPTSLG